MMEGCVATQLAEEFSGSSVGDDDGSGLVSAAHLRSRRGLEKRAKRESLNAKLQHTAQRIQKQRGEISA